MRTDEPVSAHQAGDAVPTDPVPALSELTEHAWRPVGATRLGVDLADPLATLHRSVMR
jgi:hypothetical protein